MTQHPSEIQPSPMPQPQDALPPAPAPLAAAEQTARTEAVPIDPLALNRRFHENRKNFPEE